MEAAHSRRRILKAGGLVGAGALGGWVVADTGGLDVVLENETDSAHVVRAELVPNGKRTNVFYTKVFLGGSQPADGRLPREREDLSVTADAIDDRRLFHRRFHLDVQVGNEASATRSFTNKPRYDRLEISVNPGDGPTPELGIALV